MKIDFGTLAFGCSLNHGSSTPNWATCLGQGQEYKINNDNDINEILKGMIYCSVPVHNTSLKVGKGGNYDYGNTSNTSIVHAALFNKVYINDKLINNGKFLLIITKDNSESHKGRLKLKYGKSNTLTDGNNSFSNDDFFKLAYEQLELDEKACWFIYDISIRNQNELLFKAVIVDDNNNVQYENTNEMHYEWDCLVPVIEENIIIESFDQFKQYFLVKDNKIFAYRILNFMTKYQCYSSDVLSILTSREKMLELFHHSNNVGGLLLKALDKDDLEKSYSEQCKDDNQINRYYAPPYTININNECYFISKEWKADQKEPFLEWVFKILTTIKYGEEDAICIDQELQKKYEKINKKNRIIFGAPGTGKSYELELERKALLGVIDSTNDKKDQYERVTFHPDYTYANFVGAYKPVSNNKEISYEYVPGPFMRVLVKALKNYKDEVRKPYLLIIEEINRANMAAVFGDVFQLLDRGNGVSEYSIQTTEDMRNFLKKELKSLYTDAVNCDYIKIPENMFIWATMNSADQGVFPMDTAFKRRWEFEYMPINLSMEEAAKDNNRWMQELFEIGNYSISWEKIRKFINKHLIYLGVNEDRQLGPFFIKRESVTNKDGNISKEKFVNVFNNKVIMYLYEDIRQTRRGLFVTKENDVVLTYSELCDMFRNKSVEVFGDLAKDFN